MVDCSPLDIDRITIEPLSTSFVPMISAIFRAASIGGLHLGLH